MNFERHFAVKYLDAFNTMNISNDNAKTSFFKKILEANH